MKATLEFDLNDFDDKQELRKIIFIGKLTLLLSDIHEMFRYYRKYENLTEEQELLLDKLSGHVHELYEKHAINLWEF